VTLQVIAGRSALVLPQRAPRSNDGAEPFLPSEMAPLTPVSQVTEGSAARYAHYDMYTGTMTYVTKGEGSVFGGGASRFDEIGTVNNHCLTRHLTIQADDPLSARYKIEQSYELSRPDWPIRIETITEMTASKTEFFLTGRLDAFEDGRRVVSRNWHETIKRDLL